MSCIGCAGAVRIDAATGRRVVRLLSVAVAGALLAGCARSSVVTGHSEAPAAGRQASLPHERASVTHRRVASVEQPKPFAPGKETAGTPRASQGIASFYSEGARTASGEKFDASQLTAAHPTLPFGTKLRVTNVTNGQSVMVRVNDRGPYVPGRIVDVSYSAADKLGMVDGGLARVKLDVVQ